MQRDLTTKIFGTIIVSPLRCGLRAQSKIGSAEDFLRGESSLQLFIRSPSQNYGASPAIGIAQFDLPTNTDKRALP